MRSLQYFLATDPLEFCQLIHLSLCHCIENTPWTNEVLNVLINKMETGLFLKATSSKDVSLTTCISYTVIL